jgi:hypothetical protein
MGIETENKIKIAEILKKSLFYIADRGFLNATPHELRLDDGQVIPGSVELAKILSARPIEKEVNKIPDFTIVTTEFVTTPEGRELVKIANEFKIILIGSIIAAQAYKFPVVSPIATPETSRLPPEQRIVFSRKFNTFI